MLEIRSEKLIWARLGGMEMVLSKIIENSPRVSLGLPRWHSGRNLPANAGDARATGFHP